MELELTPKVSTDNSLIGVLTVDGVNECFTLERPWNNGDNATGVSAIPGGRYRVKFEFSPHFNKQMMHLQDVPGRTHIMVHNANMPGQLHGCIAVGVTRATDWVGASVEALNKLTAKVQAALQGDGEVWITIKRPD